MSYRHQNIIQKRREEENFRARFGEVVQQHHTLAQQVSFEGRHEKLANVGTQKLQMKMMETRKEEGLKRRRMRFVWC